MTSSSSREGTSSDQQTYADTLQFAADEIRQKMDARDRGEDARLSIPTGLRQWDENGGIDRGVLTVIGAATGDGKSLVKLHLATAAAQAGMRVRMLDFEDPRAKTAHRTFAAVTGLDSKDIGKLRLDEFDYERIAEALKASSEWAERIEHCVGLVSTERALELMNRTPTPDLILVDYAQCFAEDQGRNLERTISGFAKAAGAVAQKTNAGIVVFSQLRAEVEKRGKERYDLWKQWGQHKGKPPDFSGYCPTGLTDIAWAKTLGDSAKCLLYLWRPGRVAHKEGHKKVLDDRLLVIVGKANFASEDDMIFKVNLATATISDWPEGKAEAQNE